MVADAPSSALDPCFDVVYDLSGATPAGPDQVLVSGAAGSFDADTSEAFFSVSLPIGTYVPPSAILRVDFKQACPSGPGSGVVVSSGSTHVVDLGTDDSLSFLPAFCFAPIAPLVLVSSCCCC